jgi:hypothetical protein
MFERKPKLKALSGAEKVIDARNKLSKTIQAEESKLLALILSRVEADRELIAAETAVAMGEQPDSTTAQRKAENAMVVINKQAAILGGLRSRLAGMAGELETQARVVQAALPAHVETLKADFAAEWEKACSAFAAALGRRAALESLIGKFDLPQPQPAACDLGDVAAPWAAIDSLRAALTEISGWSNAASMAAFDAMNGGGRSFDAEAVYVLLRPCDSLPAGQMVMEPSFVPGFLRHWLSIGYAEPLANQDWQTSVEAGARAARALDSEAEQRRQQEQHESDRARGGFAAYDGKAATEAAAANAQIPNNVAPENVNYARPVQQSDSQAAARFKV